MARTIQNLYVTGGQTFRITINGLNPVTEVKLFFDGVLVPSSQVKQILANETGSDTLVGPIFNVSGYADKLITNLNGAITFDFTYTDSIAKQNFTTEEAYYRYAQLNGGPKSLIVIDAATAATVTGSLSNTVDSDNLTQTLRKARCHAFGVIQLSYGIQFTEIKPISTTTYYDINDSLRLDGPDPGITPGEIAGDPESGMYGSVNQIGRDFGGAETAGVGLNGDNSNGAGPDGTGF